VSRGYGYVQRFVLAELDEQSLVGDEWVRAGTLAARLDGALPTREARRSVRRALSRLATDGLVEIVHRAAEPEGAIGRTSQRGMLARVARAHMDEVAERRACRARARDLRRDAREGVRGRFGLSNDRGSSPHGERLTAQGAHTHVAPHHPVRARP
jgi:hypothetical protein